MQRSRGTSRRGQELCAKEHGKRGVSTADFADLERVRRTARYAWSDTFVGQHPAEVWARSKHEG